MQEGPHIGTAAGLVLRGVREELHGALHVQRLFGSPQWGDKELDSSIRIAYASFTELRTSTPTSVGQPFASISMRSAARRLKSAASATWGYASARIYPLRLRAAPTRTESTPPHRSLAMAFRPPARLKLGISDPKTIEQPLETVHCCSMSDSSMAFPQQLTCRPKRFTPDCVPRSFRISAGSSSSFFNHASVAPPSLGSSSSSMPACPESTAGAWMSHARSRTTWLKARCEDGKCAEICLKALLFFDIFDVSSGET